MKKREFFFNNENMFFYEPTIYDVNSSLLDYQIGPSKNLFRGIKDDYFKPAEKPLMMDSKIFLDNQFTAFEKFYLKKGLYEADHYTYLNHMEVVQKLTFSDKDSFKKVESQSKEKSKLNKVKNKEYKKLFNESSFEYDFSDFELPFNFFRKTTKNFNKNPITKNTRQVFLEQAGHRGSHFFDNWIFHSFFSTFRDFYGWVEDHLLQNLVM